MNDILLKTLPEVSAWQAQNQGEATAFVFEEQTINFQKFEENSNQVAQGLLAEGIKPQARIALLGKDSITGYELLFGVAKAGGVLIGLNWRLTAQEILYILNDGETEILFVEEAFFPIVAQIQKDFTTVKKIIALHGNHREWEAFQTWRNTQSTQAPTLEYHEEDAVIQMYTSGTTGHPKGVQLAHYSFFRLMQGMKAQGDHWMDLQVNDTLLLSLPMFHIGGLWWAMQGFIVGARGVILDTFIAWKAVELIEKLQITKVAMVPAMIQFVLAEPSSEKADFSSVQGFLYGGSPIAPTLMRKATEIFRCGFFQIYGMTETGNMAVCLRPGDHDLESETRTKAAGKPLPGVEAKITDTDGNNLPPHQTGEIWLKSPSVMLGYWKREAATQETLVDGWIRTGDAGYMDEQGYIYVSDRMKDMIIYAGENVFPAEIEAVLSAHEAVREVAVIGVPDERWGETVKAITVLKPGFTLKKRELIAFAKGKLADFKLPKSVTFVEELPRNPSGKVLKRVLRAPYWEGKERQVN